MRLPFIILTPACVLLGLSTAVWESGRVNFFHFILALIGAIAAHISVNAFNEYFDFKSGLDAKTKRTPFSGGSGSLQMKPELATDALIIALCTFVLTALIGTYFIMVRGIGIIPIGIAGLLVILAYTPWVTRNPLVCLLAPGLGFGTLMVLGTHFVLTGQYSWTAFIASLVPFFLVSDLLLLNQFPDVEADRSIGRKHFPILIGNKASSILYGAFLLLTYASIIFGTYFKFLPKFSLLGLITLVFAVPAFIGAYRYSNDIKKLIRFMGMNVVINIVTPVLVAIGLFVGK